MDDPQAQVRPMTDLEERDRSIFEAGWFAGNLESTIWNTESAQAAITEAWAEDLQGVSGLEVPPAPKKYTLEEVAGLIDAAPIEEVSRYAKVVTHWLRTHGDHSTSTEGER